MSVDRRLWYRRTLRLKLCLTPLISARFSGFSDFALLRGSGPPAREVDRDVFKPSWIEGADRITGGTAVPLAAGRAFAGAGDGSKWCNQSDYDQMGGSDGDGLRRDHGAFWAGDD